MHRFHPVIFMPPNSPVYDLSGNRGHVKDDRDQASNSSWGIGKYNEKRLNMYSSEIFRGEDENPKNLRDIHVGIDLFAPVGTPIHAFEKGRIHLFGYNSAHLDYGYTLITEHTWGGLTVYALHGHLGRRSIEGKVEGQKVEKGDVIAWVGDEKENGGWPPHLHFQLSFERPLVPDMPGVVSDEDHALALLKYPDPRLVLGPLY